MDRIRRGANNGQMVKVSAKTLNNLTPERRDVLEAEVESGQIRSGTWQVASTDRIAKSGSTNTPVGAIVHSYQYVNKMVKTANPVTGGTTNVGSGLPGGGSVERMAPEVYSPLYTMANLNLPRDPITVNAWVRNMYLLHPIVRNVINLHATYPISKINLKCHDTKVLRFFEDMAEEMDLMGSVGDVALEWWKHGEKVDKNSLVTMSDGSVKPIYEVKIGDYVLTHLGNKKKVIDRFAKPTDTVKEEHLKIYKISFVNLPGSLIISGKHPIFHTKFEDLICKTPSCTKKHVRVLPRHKRCSNCHAKNKNIINPEFIETNKIKEKDIAYSPFNSEVINNIKFNKDLCYLMGFWLAEGCYCKTNNSSKNRYNGIKFCNYNEKYMYKTLSPLIEKTLGYKGNMYISERHEGDGFSKKDLTYKYDYWFDSIKRNGPEIANFFKEHCGEYSKEKKLSETIMLLPPELQAYIIAGFVDGDGCIDKSNGHAILCTSSKDLANQFTLILRRCGVHVSFHNGKSTYRVKINANESYELLKDKLKMEKVSILNKKSWCSPQSSLYKNWQMLTIKKIEDITKKYNESIMYDLEVEDDHSYIANGIAVHNCFPYAELDESSGKWKKIVIQNPDYVRIKKSVLSGEPVISLRADETLQRLVSSNNPADVQIRSQIPENILYYIRAGQPIPLDNFNVSHLKMTASPYDLRGTSIIVSVFKDIMRYDKIMECKFAQADGMINPITVIKVGGNADGDYRATQEDIEYYRQLFEEAQFDKDFKLITHAGITVERIGYSGQIIDESQDLAFIVKNIYTGLMIPPAVVDTEGSVYNSASIGLEVLRQRYFNFRNMMARWLTNKIFAPISEINDFYEFKDGVKKLIVPEIEYNHMNLYDLQDYITNITGLAQNKQVSLQTVYRSLGLNYEEERIKIRQEIINETIREKEVENLKKMSITELRALDPEKEISELVTTKETEENTSAEIPGGEVPELGAGLSLSPTEAPTGGLGGGGLGTMPTPEAPPPGGPGASGGGEMPPI